MTNARVTMIGGFPPPVGGAALITAMICDALVTAGVDVTKVNVSGQRLSHSRNLAFHTHRASRNSVSHRAVPTPNR